MNVYVIAMENEARCLVERMENAREEIRFGRRVTIGSYLGEETAVVLAGVGKTNAAAGAQIALGLNPREIRNFGVAGGFADGMKVGDIYGISRAVEYDFDLAAINGTEIGVHNERTTPYFDCVTTGAFPSAVLGTGDRFNDDDADLATIRRLGITVRDMEGAAIAHVAETAGAACRIVKAISDVHGAGSMTGQYRRNLGLALDALKSALPSLSRLAEPRI